MLFRPVSSPQYSLSREVFLISKDLWDRYEDLYQSLQDDVDVSDVDIDSLSGTRRIWYVCAAMPVEEWFYLLTLKLDQLKDDFRLSYQWELHNEVFPISPLNVSDVALAALHPKAEEICDRINQKLSVLMAVSSAREGPHGQLILPF